MRYQKNNGSFSDKYPHHFGKQDFERLLSMLQYADNVLPLEEWFTCHTPRTIGLQHDIDHNIDHAVKFAKWEYEHGIRSTYFILHTAWYYEDKGVLYVRMNELLGMGHEVGLHHSVAGDPVLLEAVLTQLREKGFRILGAAAHGSVKNFHDMRVWDRVTPQQLGLEYEAYQDPGGWMMDNHGQWLEPLSKSWVDRGGKYLHLSIHPCHWDIDQVL